MAPKRKLSGTTTIRVTKRKTGAAESTALVSPSPSIIDGKDAARASPAPIVKEEVESARLATKSTIAQRSNAQATLDPESDEDGIEDDETSEVYKAAIARPPPVNSSYLPLPWKGRLGYACLNTYLRYSNPPVFSSRTCRIASIIEHRHALKDPSQPEHATKNRPDKDQPADIQRGQKWVESLGLANARDVVKMIRWNDRYGIRFMRLSSEMFPFASHEEYGYNLAFAADVLAEAGKVIAELGHRVTTHPGQFTQLGSPRKQVVDNALRDLEYHSEMLTRLRLPEQQDRDAVMILHMGGTFGSKEETLERFRTNYARCSDNIKRRLVLENDDVSWSVHDLLPICEELNIPMVLDFHHHNIVFDSSQVREGTADIVQLFPRIRATWTRKQITPKMHYSEPTPQAITPMKRRKHSPRVATLPPCADDMDLMIEAKDKEQAVFELMRIFKLPGYQTFNDIIPHVRPDENPKPTMRKKKKADTEDESSAPQIADNEVGMGGPNGRVYWPLGMEHWLRPKKREVKPKDENAAAKLKTPKKVRQDNTAKQEEPLQETVDDARRAKKSVGKPSTQADVKQTRPAPLKSKKKTMQTSPVPLPIEHLVEPLKSSKAGRRKVSEPVSTKPQPVPADSVSRRGRRVTQVNYNEA